MCAIVGLVSPKGCIDRDVLQRMRDKMEHRGPDDAGLYLNKTRTVGLGHRRLSIIDLSSHGHQPMTNEDESIWLTYNGEIYNFREIREQLLEAGHTFKSDSDSEIIIHAYEEWGVESVHRFRGMFAYAIWDEKQQQLFLVRDRLGIKPLFYSCQDNALSFASEIKALVTNPAISLSLDETAIYDFLTYRYIPTPKTIYQNIKKLPPGHFAVFRDGRLFIDKYWDPVFGGVNSIAEDEAVYRLRDSLNEVVNYHLISDVPLGVMLSGGLDSSALCALAANNMREPLHTFSIGFDVREHSETQYARIVAEQYETVHHELTVTRDMAETYQEKVRSLYDEPFADSSSIPTYFVSRLARENVTVALSGEGGDELFGGYSWYPKNLEMAKLDVVPFRVRRFLGKQMRKLHWNFKGKWTLEMAGLDPIQRYTTLMSGLLKEEKKAIFSKRFINQFHGYDDYWYFRKHWRSDLDSFSRMQYLDFKTFLNDDVLTKMDRASMSVSLEARVPLLDHELITAVLQLPVNMRNKGFQQKYLFKKAITNDLPASILARKKKGFSAPMHEWLKKYDTSYLEPMFDRGLLSENYHSRMSPDAAESWSLITISRWLHENC